MSVFVYMPLLSFEKFVEFHKSKGNVMSFEVMPIHNIKLLTRSCVNLSYRSLIYDPWIVYINVSLGKGNVFRCDRFTEYEIPWGYMTSVFIYTVVVRWNLVKTQTVTHDYVLGVMCIK